MQDVINQPEKTEEVKTPGEPMIQPQNLPVISQTNTINSPQNPSVSNPSGELPVVAISSHENHIPVWFLLLFFVTIFLFLTMTVLLYQKIKYRETLSHQAVTNSAQTLPSATPSPLPQVPGKGELTPLGVSDELTVIENDINNTNTDSLNESFEVLDREVTNTK